MFYLNIAIILLIPLCQSLLGFIWRKGGPAIMGCSYGYRSRRSLYSRESWDFAHRFMGKIWAMEGPFMTILSLVVFLYLNSNSPENLKSAMVYIMVVQLAQMFIPVIIAERALALRFPQAGVKRPRR